MIDLFTYFPSLRTCSHLFSFSSSLFPLSSLLSLSPLYPALFLIYHVIPQGTTSSTGSSNSNSTLTMLHLVSSSSLFLLSADRPLFPLLSLPPFT